MQQYIVISFFALPTFSPIIISITLMLLSLKSNYLFMKFETTVKGA